MNSFPIASAFTETQKSPPQTAAQNQAASPDSTHIKEKSSSFGRVYNTRTQPAEEHEDHALLDATETELVDEDQNDLEEAPSLDSPDQNPNIQDENNLRTDENGDDASDFIDVPVDGMHDEIPSRSANLVDISSRDQPVTSFAHLKTNQDLPPSKPKLSPMGSRLEGADQISKPSIQTVDALPNKDVAQHVILGQSADRDPSKPLPPSMSAQVPGAQRPGLENSEVNKNTLIDQTTSVSTKSEANIPVDTKQGTAALVLPNKSNPEPKIERKNSAAMDLSTPRTPSASDPYSAVRSVSELAQNTAMRPNVHSGNNVTPTQSIIPASLAKSEPSLVRDNDVPIMSTEFRGTGTTPSTSFVGQVTSSSQASLARNVSMQISEALRNTAQRPVEISLNPAELGRLRMTVTAVDGAITLQVLAERPETLDLMRKNMDSLSRDLSDLGFTSIDLAFGQGKDADAEKRATGSSSGLTHDDPKEQQMSPEAQIVLPPVHLDGSGRLDIRV